MFWSRYNRQVSKMAGTIAIKRVNMATSRMGKRRARPPASEKVDGMDRLGNANHVNAVIVARALMAAMERTGPKSDKNERERSIKYRDDLIAAKNRADMTASMSRAIEMSGNVLSGDARNKGAVRERDGS